MEQNLSYRYFDEINRNYIQTNLIAREFNKSSPSYGLQARIDHDPVAFPVSFFVDGKTFVQNFNNHNNYSIFGEFGLMNNLVWNRKLNQTFSVSTFGRVVNYKTTNTLDSKYPDPDVYSFYNRKHPKGIDTSYVLNYSPLLDSRIWGRAALKTSSHLHKIDQVAFSVGADQLINPCIIGINYSHKKYFKGDVRMYSFNRQEIGGYTNWEHWLSTKNHRVEVNLNIAKVFDTDIPKKRFNQIQPKPLKDWVGKIGVTVHLGNGRGYRDFKNDEIKFKKIRARYVPVKNEIKNY